MSKISLSPNALGTGTFTIASPNSNTDRTVSLPDAAGTVFLGGQALTATTGTFSAGLSGTTGNFSAGLSGTTGNFSGNVTLGSSVLATPTGTAPSYLCRAWVNFNGTGTVAIRASGNVSSITDGGTGIYTVNFTTAMTDANYSVSCCTQIATSNQVITNISAGGTMTTTALPIVTIDRSSTGVAIDCSTVAVQVFR